MWRPSRPMSGQGARPAAANSRRAAAYPCSGCGVRRRTGRRTGRLERERPPAPDGPAVQYLSADGAMVPLVGGEWAEVKTLAIGVVEVRPGEDGLPEAHTSD